MNGKDLSKLAEEFENEPTQKGKIDLLGKGLFNHVAHSLKSMDFKLRVTLWVLGILTALICLATAGVIQIAVYCGR